MPQIGPVTKGGMKEVVSICVPGHQCCEVFPNYEMVMFQPRTVTPPHLGSIAIVTLKLALPPNLFLPFVWIFLLSPPSYRPAPPSVAVHRQSPLSFSPTPVEKRRPYGLRPHPPLSSLVLSIHCIMLLRLLLKFYPWRR